MLLLWVLIPYSFPIQLICVLLKWLYSHQVAGCVACIGEQRTAYEVFVGKLEGKRPLGRPGDSTGILEGCLTVHLPHEIK